MAASASGVAGSGRAERRRRWCSCAGVMGSGAAEDDEGSRLRMDHEGLERMEAARGLVLRVRVVVCWGVREMVVIERRRARRQDVQRAIVGEFAAADTSEWDIVVRGPFSIRHP